MCLIVDEMKALESKGLASIVESMDTVLEYNIWANGGQMNADELADLCDRLAHAWTIYVRLSVRGNDRQPRRGGRRTPGN